MNAELLQSHSALILASVTGLVLLALALTHIIRASARGQLRRVRKALAAERARLRKTVAVVARAERQKSRLAEHADKVKPRHLQEANEALQDAKALARIANDRVLIAENHLRRVILEEFPPAQQEKLRNRYLPDSPVDKKPFTF
jgi:hypothetical protein